MVLTARICARHLVSANETTVTYISIPIKLYFDCPVLCRPIITATP